MRFPRRLRLAAVALLLLTSGCFSMSHTVGAGPIGQGDVHRTQWWWGFGLFPIGAVPDSQELANGAIDYRVRTGFTTRDVLVSAIPSILSFYRQSVIVER